MINQYPLWRYLLLLAIVLAAVVFALPNLYPEDPAVQISAQGDNTFTDAEQQTVLAALDAAGVPPLDSTGELSADNKSWLLRFADKQAQKAAREKLYKTLDQNAFISALNIAPRTPEWLQNIGAKPMSLGLDLRGGVHFLLQVDYDSLLQKARDGYAAGVPRQLSGAGVGIVKKRYRWNSGPLVLEFANEAAVSEAKTYLRKEYSELIQADGETAKQLLLTISQAELERRQGLALDQNVQTLRNRVFELGVSEPVIQRQGVDRIIVQLPGVQDTAQAKKLLGRTATLQFRLVYEGESAHEIQRSGRTLRQAELFQHKDGFPVLLRRDVIAYGDELVDAQDGIDTESSTPAVFVTLGGKAAERMLETTKKNVGKPMAALFIESAKQKVDGKLVTVESKKVISIATIRGVFGKSFQTTGLTNAEASELALLLRSGALAAPVYVIEERTVGPSLGQDNIDNGFLAVQIGFALVVLFMLVYYRVFGFIANLALALNLVIIVAVLSLTPASLTLPGIAGVVLTVGMAVDANVLIFERIREELRAGVQPHYAIAAGYDKAFSTIADANITTFIAGVILAAVGTGPIQGFAITLIIGIATSMFTAIFGTRAVVNLIYGGRSLKKIWI